MVHLVIGAQWGDEGKGKIVDLLAQDADYVVRFHGGNNAGHTVINEYGTFPLHLVPSGIFNPKCQVFITGGVVIDMGVLIQELDMLQTKIPDFSQRLYISPRAHVIMPYHKLLDALYENAKGKAKTGTTGRGIGPAYADKVSYQGIRVGDFSNPKKFKEKLEILLKIKNKIIKGLGEKPLKLEEVYGEEINKFKKIKMYVKDTFPALQKAIRAKKNILLEGAQGVFLDNDWGTYPFVTASSVVSGSVTGAAGIPSQQIQKVTGVVKAYVTRVGQGPFPTELEDDIGETLRKRGHEFGTTTGRPRRCGWLDLELLRFACQLNGITDLAITKLDILDTFSTIKICVGHTLKGKKVSYSECDSEMLSQVKPVYKILKGWQQATNKIKKKKDLPQEVLSYLQEIEKQSGVSVSLLSVGPHRDETILF